MSGKFKATLVRHEQTLNCKQRVAILTQKPLSGTSATKYSISIMQKHIVIHNNRLKISSRPTKFIQTLLVVANVTQIFWLVAKHIVNNCHVLYFLFRKMLNVRNKHVGMRGFMGGQGAAPAPPLEIFKFFTNSYLLANVIIGIKIHNTLN